MLFVIRMSHDELIFWIGSYECASGLVHLKGHFDDDPREDYFPSSLVMFVCVYTTKDTCSQGHHEDRHAVQGNCSRMR